ncbi:MAG TPA: protein kinase [Thermoanaerobaculia bacterium]|nr:protein kinase [Thermoanaerobaculia bacterium]
MDNLGKYQVLRKIGQGGFGIVYEGYDPAIRRRVAIKTCTSADPRVRLRFAREAEITGNLSHPNIVVMFDYGEVDGNPYLVQEFLVGEDLEEKIARRERIPLATKVNYLIQVADALSHAHRQGVVHRDVKPSNVRVLETGIVKVMDFGIAWIKNHESITLTGRTVGTAAYMAPEQLRNEPVGPRADIFSFGVLAYELLTQERAFAGDSPSQVLYQVLNVEPVPIRARSPDVPVELAALIAGCHRKDPEERYRSLDALIPALQHVELSSADGEPLVPSRSASSPPPATSPPPAPARRASPAGPISAERTQPLSLPAHPAATAGSLDHVELRLRAPPQQQPAPLARAVAARRSLTGPLAALALVLALAALATAAVTRRQTIGPLLSSWLGGAETAGALVAAAEERDPEQTSTPSASPTPSGPAAAEPALASSRDDPPQAAPADTSPVPRVAAGVPVSVGPATAQVTRRAPAAAASAALSVRAALGAPQGWAWLDDEPLGRTPIRSIPVAPGTRRLRVVLDPNGVASALPWEVTLTRGQELILTIDPSTGEPPHHVRRPLSRP